MARPVTPPPSRVRRPADPRRPDAPRRLLLVGVVVAALAVLGVGWIGVAGQPASSVPPGLVAAASGDALPSATATANASVGPADSASSRPPASPSPAASPSTAPSTAPLPGASGQPPATARTALEARLQSSLDRLRTKNAIPGVSATILFPDGTSWTGVSGLAEVATKTPVTPDTAFAFASMSKTFTSALILQLAAEGKLTLGASAASLLPPGLPITLDRRITVAMLLDHTSGLADYFLNPKIDRLLQRTPTKAWTPADALRYVGKPLSPPGRAWHYSNTNYLLLGLIAERLTGKSMATLVRERFLDPLHLDATWYQSEEKPRAPLADGYRVTSTKPTARPADLDDGSGVAPFRSVVTAAGGAGSVAGTSADVARWARALYGGDVLGPVGTGLLLSDFTKTTNYVPGVSYGFGVQALSIDGHPTLGHSGRLLGFRGVVRHLPVEGVTIAVLTNQSRADPAVVARALLRIVLPPPPRPAPSARPTPSSSVAPAG
jgi:D-alanyl-D-alanine carboxypeptidase